MASPAMGILDDILQALRACGAFVTVVVGGSLSDCDVPRACLLYDGCEPLASDDDASARWGRLRLTVVVRTRSLDVIAGVRRADSLCHAAADALLADPYRGGRCEDLPAGRATEVGRWQLSRTVKRPEIEMSFDVRCHFQEAQ